MLTFIKNNNRFIHSIKTAIAVLIGFAVTKLINLQINQWLVITIIVVMCAQMNVGSMVQKSYLRFVGTLVGSLIALLTLIVFGNEFFVVAIVVSLSALFFSYIATGTKNYNEAGTLGAVTVAIILITPHPTIITAAERFLEISAGILIAALVSQFVLPIHASRNLRDNQAHTLLLLRDYYKDTLLSNDPSERDESIDEAIVKLLITQRKLASEAKNEIFGKAYKNISFKKSLWCEKEILRSITFMYHAYQASIEMQKLFLNAQAIQDFHAQTIETLSQIAANLKKIKTHPITLPDINHLKESIGSIIKVLPSEEIIYANSFLFAAEVLVQRLGFWKE